MFVKSFILVLSLTTKGQDSIPKYSKNITPLPVSYCRQVSHKADAVAKRLEWKSTKSINSLLATEQRMRDKLSKTNKAAADQIFGPRMDSLRCLRERVLKHVILGPQRIRSASVDSLSNTINFLKSNQGIFGNVPSQAANLAKASKSIRNLEGNLESAEIVRNALQSQKAMLNEQLSDFASLSNELQRLNKEAYYYTQQLAEYKEMLHDRKKAEQKAQQLLAQLPAYKNFMAQHSTLANLIGLSSGSAGVRSTAGLQTRTAVEQVIQQRLAGASPESVRSQMDVAQQQLNALKSKYSNLNNPGEMPDFKPKDLKTKSLRQRLEFGANTQFQKSNRFFPTIMDVAGQAGYKFSKKGIVGFGMSYKLGLGEYNHIHFTSQGLGLRTFLEWKIKQSLYASGGFEQNYNSQFQSIDNLYSINKWTGSALLGISKKIQLNNRLKGNVMLLYDFLWSTHTPNTQPLLLRMGYNF